MLRCERHACAARWLQADSRPAARAQVRVQACAAGVQGVRGGHGACAACQKHPPLGGGTEPYAPWQDVASAAAARTEARAQLALVKRQARPRAVVLR